MPTPAATRVAINGFGRIGRLALRAAWGWPELAFVHVNELHGDSETAAHLLTFDSIHGRWPHETTGSGDALTIDGQRVSYGSAGEPGAVPWDELGVDVVLECSGRFRTQAKLAPYFERGVRKVSSPPPPRTAGR